jgi:hypothetical protein
MFFKSTLVSIDHPEAVEMANAAGGPQIRMTEDGRGYGLFAQREYEEGEFVTYYDGVSVILPTAADAEEYALKHGNAYSLIINANRNGFMFIDGEKLFHLTNKGRFVNESQRGQNVDMVYSAAQRAPKFITTRRVYKGEEFLWFYGDGYDRSHY